MEPPPQTGSDVETDDATRTARGTERLTAPVSEVPGVGVRGPLKPGGLACLERRRTGVRCVGVGPKGGRLWYEPPTAPTGGSTGLLVSSPRSGQRGEAGVRLRIRRRSNTQKQSQHPHSNLHISQTSLTGTNLDSNRKGDAADLMLVQPRDTMQSQRRNPLACS